MYKLFQLILYIKKYMEDIWLQISCCLRIKLLRLGSYIGLSIQLILKNVYIRLYSSVGRMLVYGTNGQGFNPLYSLVIIFFSILILKIVCLVS